ncbi:hypothetical protein ACB098_04G101500 [Castanea mollissima]
MGLINIVGLLIGVVAPPFICAFHFSLFFICLLLWSLSLSSCCRGSDWRSGFADQCGGMARWRSVWRRS